MTASSYIRPAKTKATNVGNRNRSRWTRQLRSRLFRLVPALEAMNAEEGVISAAKRKPWSDRPRWVSIQIRTDHMAVIELLQSRHLKATGKEISRAETLAALMTEGLQQVLNHIDFGGKGD